jgi:hypothetical protein
MKRKQASFAIALALLFAGVISLTALPILPSNLERSSSSSNGSVTSSSSAAAFAGFPELSVGSSDCGSVYPNGDSFCSPESVVKTPIEFNLTTSTVQEGNATVVPREQYFGVQVDPGALLQYTFSSNSGPPAFTVYLDNGTGASVMSMPKEISDHKLQVLANEAEYQAYSGQTRSSQVGLLMFAFSATVFTGESVITFLLRNATTLENGISVSIGSPTVHKTNITTPDGSGETEFVSLEEWPITLQSNSTTEVDLASPNHLGGVWVSFLPSQVNVGPEGANVTMLLAGAVRPFDSGPDATSSLFIDAQGSSGLTGEAVLPIIRSGTTLNILQAAAPINFDEISTFGPPQNLTQFDVVGAVYDPGTGSASNRSLSVVLSAEGLLENGTVTPFPSWITVIIPQSSFRLNASQPFYFQVGATVPSVPEGGAAAQYVVVLDEKVGGENFLVNLTIDVSPEVQL